MPKLRKLLINYISRQQDIIDSGFHLDAENPECIGPYGVEVLQSLINDISAMVERTGPNPPPQTLAALDIVFVWYRLDNEPDFPRTTHIFGNRQTAAEIKAFLDRKHDREPLTIELIER